METLAPSLRGLSKALENLRSFQVKFYQDREADNKLESPSSYTEVHDLFSAFFRMIISHPEPWATTLLIAHDKDDIGSDIGQPQRFQKITSDFHALDHIGWYSGACFLLVGTTSALFCFLQLPVGPSSLRQYNSFFSQPSHPFLVIRAGILLS